MDAISSKSIPMTTHALSPPPQTPPAVTSSPTPASPAVVAYDSQDASSTAPTEEKQTSKYTPLTKKTSEQSSGVSATSCANCGTTTTPLWRRAPNGDTICNACGLYFKARHQFRPPTLKRSTHRKAAESASDCGSGPNGGSCPGGGHCNGTGGSESCAGCPAFNQHQVNRQSLICFNCQTTTTPLWRRDDAGNTICNACGLYYKLHNMHRPVSMKRTVIKRRKRIIVTGNEASEEEKKEQDNAADASTPSVVHKRRAKGSLEKKGKRQRGSAQTEQQPKEPQDDSILPVPAIEDYIVPKRAKLPSEMMPPSPHTTHPSPSTASPGSTPSTASAAQPPSDAFREQRSTSPILPLPQSEGSASRHPPATPPSLSSTPTSSTALSPPLTFGLREDTVSLPPISSARRSHRGIDSLLNSTPSSPPPPPPSLPRLTLPPISLAYLPPDPPVIRPSSSETTLPSVPSLIPSSLSNLEPRSIAEIDAAMNRLAELRRQMTAAAGRQ